MSSDVAKGPCAPPETNPRHILEVCPAPGGGGAVSANQGNRGEVRGSWRLWRASTEEASGEKGQDVKLGKSSHLQDKQHRVQNHEFKYDFFFLYE